MSTTPIILEAELKKAGLHGKQALAYLVLLELGPSSVQRVARKAAIPRATTYVLIDSLMKAGLVDKVTVGKRPLFVAGKPDRLLEAIETKQKVLQHQQEDIQNILPLLQAMYHPPNQAACARYFPGRNGIQAMRQEMTRQCSKEDTWYNFAPADSVATILGKANISCRERAAKGVHSKTIFTTASADMRTYVINTSRRHKVQRKFIDPQKLAIASGITICQDKVAIVSYTGQVGGILLEHQSFATTLQQFFEILWMQLE